MTGSLCILNAGAGDIELKWNQHDDAERSKAVRLLTEMQRRGYAILVREGDGSYSRAIEIDATRGVYILQAPALPAGEVVDAEVVHPKALPPATGVDDGPALPGKRRRSRREVPIGNAHAVGIGRSAGG
jgi:hypothetical protein